jgi:glycosyltransferase involved in cell wall biosynthesis/putative flippase GtrA
MKNKIKVLVTTGIYPPEIGGPATYTALLEKELPKFGVDVEVLPFRTVKHLPKIIRHLAFFGKILNLGKKMNLLYTQDPVSVGFPTMLAAKILGKPFLARIAGDYAWEQAAQRFTVSDGIDDFQNKKYGWRVEILRLIQKITAEMADEIITPSKYFRDLVANWNPKKNNIITVYNGINLLDIPQNNEKFEPKTIISAGRLVPWKGFDVLIEIMKDLPDWKLFIAGDGPDKERLSNLIENLKLNGRIFLLGKVDRKDLLNRMQKCEIFILNTSFESFSFQIVEAMFAGTPVISTNIGNISEIVENGKDGLLVSPNNKEEILKAIQKLSDFSLRTKIIANAKEKAKHFSIEKTLEKTSQIILSLSRAGQGGIFKRNILLRYLIAGLTGASTQIGLLYVFTDIAGFWYIYSSLLAFTIAIIMSFSLQKFWTFADRETGKIHHQFARYIGVAIMGIFINTAFMYVLVDIFGIWYIFSQVIAGGIIAVLNFLMYKFFIFNK